MSKYVIISPVRNEEEYIRATIESVTAQTVPPTEWIIVNDGSTDATAAIVEQYMAVYPYIKLVNLTDRGYYFPGTGVVNVFNAGFKAIETPDWDFVVKLDVDLTFEPGYFPALLERFERDPKLGIASGITVIKVRGEWVVEGVRPDHPVGPSKVYRRQAFEQSGGLLPVPGWDLADILAAQMRGWTTAVFFELEVKHYRLTGTRRQGKFARSFLQGRFEYRHGYLASYSILKALKNFFMPPAVVGSVGRICGFVWASIKRDDYLFPADMRAFLRAKQRKVLTGGLSQ